ncbi:MAG: DUF4998 domain-containing protein [Niabella sp.]
MKKIIQILLLALNSFIFIVFALSSCDKMNDIQEEYANRVEQVYLGKVDSIKYYPGFGKAKLVWQINADPKIEQTIIYWNNRQDSILKPFNRTVSGIQKDSIVVDNLPEGSTLFEFVNINSMGERSLMSSATVTTWGVSFSEGLRARTLTSFNYDNDQDICSLELTPVEVGDSVVYAEVVYTNNLNQVQTVKIGRGDNMATLTGFPDGGTFTFRNVFFPPQGIDTIKSDFQTYQAPTAVTNPGVKITLKGVSSSRYFDYNGDLGEWTSAGDLIVYGVAADGSLAQTTKYAALAPRTTYREFFYYSDNQFIGITTGHQIRLCEIVNGTLSIVLTPTGANYFGSAFNMAGFIGANGFFFSIASDVVKTWFALPNATWANPNGATVATDFSYNPYTLSATQHILGVDGSGLLWSMPTSFSGAIGAKTTIGKGWSRFTKIVRVGTNVYGMEGNGDFYLFNNFDATNSYWVVN